MGQDAYSTVMSAAEEDAFIFHVLQCGENKTFSFLPKAAKRRELFFFFFFFGGAAAPPPRCQRHSSGSQHFTTRVIRYARLFLYRYPIH